MLTKEIDTNPARFAWFAVKDEARRSRENAATYTSQQRGAAETVRDLLDLAYAYKGIYINYRKTFIVVKMDSPLVRDRRQAKEIDAIFTEKGYVKVKSDQGIMIRLPRK